MAWWALKSDLCTMQVSRFGIQLTELFTNFWRNKKKPWQRQTLNYYLQCRRILGARVYWVVLGRHLGFSNCGGFGQGNICRGSKYRVEKGARGDGGEGNIQTFQKYFKGPIPPLHRSGQPPSSNYNPRWRHQITWFVISLAFFPPPRAHSLASSLSHDI